MSEGPLAVLQPGKIIQLVLKLKEENDTLKKYVDHTSVAKYEERLEKLEREIYLDKQYDKLDTIEWYTDLCSAWWN